MLMKDCLGSPAIHTRKHQNYTDYWHFCFSAQKANVMTDSELLVSLQQNMIGIVSGLIDRLNKVFMTSKKCETFLFRTLMLGMQSFIALGLACHFRRLCKNFLIWDMKSTMSAPLLLLMI